MRTSRSFLSSLCILVAAAVLFWGLATCSNKKGENGTPENCANNLDDDGDGAVDCVDDDCRDLAICQATAENCFDGLDNDLNGLVDCADPQCASSIGCAEDCGNGTDDDGNGLADCEDPACRGMVEACGEVCGDGVDNDGDGDVDCNDADCSDVIPPCGGGPTPDGMICAYQDSEPHTCECADGTDNDGDTTVDNADLHCFGPFDDNETEYATGIPGDNNGAKGDVECPFDGNSGTGNDWACCNPDDPSTNVTPNGCDDQGCCEIDVNGNTTGEHVYVRDACDFSPACGTEGKLGCACATAEECDAGQFCVMDRDEGPGFCSTCEACVVNAECENPCDCGEACFGGFARPPEECGTIEGCPEGVTACPGGDGDCNAAINERCIDGCCYATCPEGVAPCVVNTDCPTDRDYVCVTGCCIEMMI